MTYRRLSSPAVRSDSMDVELRYRTELADQFIARLERMSTEQWRDVVANHRNDNAYYRFALELATEATQFLGGERVERYQSALAERASRVHEVVRRGAADASEEMSTVAESLAIAAVHALMLRDRYGFNAGAYGELIRPFRPHVDLSDVERAATKVVTPPSSPRQPPPDPSPDVRR